jgi:hypothetical protein
MRRRGVLGIIFSSFDSRATAAGSAKASRVAFDSQNDSAVIDYLRRQVARDDVHSAAPRAFNRQESAPTMAQRFSPGVRKSAWSTVMTRRLPATCRLRRASMRTGKFDPERRPTARFAGLCSIRMDGVRDRV